MLAATDDCVGDFDFYRFAERWEISNVESELKKETDRD